MAGENLFGFDYKKLLDVKLRQDGIFEGNSLMFFGLFTIYNTIHCTVLSQSLKCLHIDLTKPWLHKEN